MYLGLRQRDVKYQQNIKRRNGLSDLRQEPPSLTISWCIGKGGSDPLLCCHRVEEILDRSIELWRCFSKSSGAVEKILKYPSRKDTVMTSQNRIRVLRRIAR
ncbi:hypothetical protein NPIL_542881 [Nephila pilipes]|uniref:Uncharacterized protein n=1 Tax=Nephila pilipes TaxID=299642 RepID=A0A8X6TD19_NEPPI|nr:hypothetical protein NPIL_542881 [Nephila pilipes]